MMASGVKWGRLLAASSVMLASLALAACSKLAPLQDKGHPPHPSVQIKARAIMPYGSGTVEYRGEMLTLREPPLFSNDDIRDISTFAPQGEMAAVVISFRPESVPRIHRFSEAAVGKMFALTANDQVLAVGRIEGPYGESLQLTLPGIESEHIQSFVRYLTEGGTPVDLL